MKSDSKPQDLINCIEDLKKLVASKKQQRRNGKGINQPRRGQSRYRGTEDSFSNKSQSVISPTNQQTVNNRRVTPSSRRAAPSEKHSEVNNSSRKHSSRTKNPPGYSSIHRQTNNSYMGRSS